MNHVPPHVPPDRVRDFDLYNLPGMTEDYHLALKRFQDASPDLFFTPRYGGYWVLNRAHLIAKAWEDHETFSSAKAIGIPRIDGLPPQLPIEADPPDHRYFRLPINIALAPAAVRHYAEEARVLAIQLIQKLKPRGECDFVLDFAKHLPMTIFLRMVDLPLKDKDWLIERTERMVRGSNEAVRFSTVQEIFGYLESWIRKRREQPGEDLISRILKLKVGDRPITHEEALSECALVLFGGLDTVAGSMAFVARFLAMNPEHRRRLVENPELIPHATEELLRRHSIPTVGRRVTRDIELDGVLLKAGDHVMLITGLHGLDDRAWKDSLEVEFGRDTRDLMSFGKGIHKCPGANLARQELHIFLEEWLKAIPEFSIKPGAQSVTASGAVAGVLSLPLTWPQ